MSTFENYMANYIFRQHLDPIRDAVAGHGIAAKYYHRGIIKFKTSQCRIERSADGNIINKGRIVKMLLAKCRTFKMYAIRMYIAGNTNLSDRKYISFAVIAKLPQIMIEVEKSTHEEAAAAIGQFELLSSYDVNWSYKALLNGRFRLNELNAARYDVLCQLIDMTTAIKHAFRFLHARADYYFGCSAEAA
ncbi:hypothetical protein F-S17_0299 [Faustovirus]|nr:hypothetical protein F-LCD7_0304 [Faustovirus]QJX72071.1 hypothetical protein F-M6_0308 [Faustovirus]QJX72565.1 hypothetical protein F-S17_0299 [Faustovirus]QJX73062.1 hypothetical protein F-VV57_0301 [Faustovirus]QJX73569.1 hypothetical protein F-VV63_0303 [Faustovirus]